LTGGLGNHAVATGEIVVAIGLSLLSIVLPYLALGLAFIIALVAWRWWWRRRQAQT
jgi:hypothetical protein